MKKNKLFNDVFGKPIKVKKVKKWYPTIPSIKHKNKKKEINKKWCRKSFTRPDVGLLFIFEYSKILYINYNNM